MKKSSENKNNIYRIMRFEHVVQIFREKAFYIAQPSSWTDPYEKRLNLPKNRVYAQCWSMEHFSEALWKSHASHGVGVRIKTTTKELEKVLNTLASKIGATFWNANVRYWPSSKINKEVGKIRSKKKRTLSDLKDLLFLKRSAFEYEQEYRAILVTNDPMTEERLKVKIDPHTFIKNIYIDPSASDELADSMISVFKEKFKYKHTCKKSILYKKHKNIDWDFE